MKFPFGIGQKPEPVLTYVLAGFIVQLLANYGVEMAVGDVSNLLNAGLSFITILAAALAARHKVSPVDQ